MSHRPLSLIVGKPPYTTNCNYRVGRIGRRPRSGLSACIRAEPTPRATDPAEDRTLRVRGGGDRSRAGRDLPRRRCEMATLTDEVRRARREADREKAREAVEALRSTDGWKRWLSCRRHFHRYSLATQLLIAFQKPDAARVAGFRAWLRLGYSVRRGERALRIWVPLPPSKRALEEWKASGEDAA